MQMPRLRDVGAAEAPALHQEWSRLVPSEGQAPHGQTARGAAAARPGDDAVWSRSRRSRRELEVPGHVLAVWSLAVLLPLSSSTARSRLVICPWRWWSLHRHAARRTARPSSICGPASRKTPDRRRHRRCAAPARRPSCSATSGRCSKSCSATGENDLVVAPHGPGHDVPWHLLGTEDQPLAQRCAVSVLPHCCSRTAPTPTLP